MCALIVMPRSRSRSIESSTWSTAFLASIVPVRDSRRSASVDLPWSMWATMEKLRMRAMAHPAQNITPRRAQAADGPGVSAPTRAPAGTTVALAPMHGAGADDGAGADRDVRAHDAVADARRPRRPRRRPTGRRRDHRRPAPTAQRSPSTASGPTSRARARAGCRAPTTHGRDRPCAAPIDRASPATSEPPRRRRGGVSVGRDAARHQVELPCAVLRRAADVEPVVVGDPAVERDAVGEEAGEELALDRHRAVGRDPRRGARRRAGRCPR